MSGSAQARKAQSSSAKERVTAVVVTYNRKALLRQCLDALQAQTHVLDQTIVVDNASTDGTPAMVRDVYPEVELMELEENRGGAGGFHAGMKRATEQEVDWVWVMDDDAEPAPDALKELFRPGLHQRNDVVGLSSYVVGTDGNPQKIHAGWYSPSDMIYSPLSHTSQCCERVGYSSFVGFLVSRRAVAQVGLPDAGLFIWGDDTEYSLRLRRVGSLHLLRNSVVVHHDAYSKERKRASVFSKAWRDRPLQQYWRNYYALRNRLLIARRYSTSSTQIAKAYTMGFMRLIRSAVAVLLFDNSKFIRLKVLLYAFLHGMRGQSGRFIDPKDFLEEWTE